MGDISAWFNSLHSGTLNTFLLIIVALIVRNKVTEHNEMYLWYQVKRASEKSANRLRKDFTHV